MSYGWWKFIHLVGVVGFVAAHGTSMAATVLMSDSMSRSRFPGSSS